MSVKLCPPNIPCSVQELDVELAKCQSDFAHPTYCALYRSWRWSIPNVNQTLLTQRIVHCTEAGGGACQMSVKLCSPNVLCTVQELEVEHAKCQSNFAHPTCHALYRSWRWSMSNVNQTLLTQRIVHCTGAIGRTHKMSIFFFFSFFFCIPQPQDVNETLPT